MQPDREKQLRARLYDLSVVSVTVAAVMLAVYLTPSRDVVSLAIFGLGVTVGLMIGWRRTP